MKKQINQPTNLNTWQPLEGAAPENNWEIRGVSINSPSFPEKAACGAFSTGKNKCLQQKTRHELPPPYPVSSAAKNVVVDGM